MRPHWLFAGTLRRQLLILMILLSIGAVTAIGIASIKIAQQVIRNHTARFGGEMLTQAAYRLGSIIDNAETTVDSLILDRRLAPLLHNLELPDPRLRETTRSALRDLLLQYKTSLLPGAELIILDSAGNIATTYNLTSVNKNLIPATFSSQSKVWRLRYPLNHQNNDLLVSGRLLELTARIISLPGQPQSGWIILHMDYRIVESIMANISLQANALSRFQSEAIVFGPEQQVIFPWIAPTDQVLTQAYQKLSGELRNTKTIETKIKGKNYLVIATPVPWTSWGVYIAAPTSRLYIGLEQIYNSILVIGLICILLAICAATLSSFFVIKPLTTLRKTMRLVEDGNLSIRAPESGPQEIQTLGRAFNRMLREVDMLTKRLVAEESERRIAVMKALQAQIAPHFLFNTLAAMAGMTSKRPPAEVAEALRSLKRILYLSIGKDGDFVSIADEFEHIHHYLYLMNIRYPGKFVLQMELPDELRLCQTIRLILQPVVENCLQHGLKTRGGRILVTAVRENEDIIIKVIDDGQGMSPEQLSSVWNRDRNRTGIGIRNVDERLKLTYGSNYGLTLASVQDKGTTVSLRIPLRYHHEAELYESEMIR